MKKVSLERLKEILNYNPETGVFTRLFDAGAEKKGSVAGVVSSSIGYILISVDGSSLLAHRLAWFYVFGAWPKNQIDHINGSRTDNRIENLREATIAENRQNQTQFLRKNSSGYLGVHKAAESGLFVASIKKDGIKRHIGCYLTPEDAHEAYRFRKIEIHPFGTLFPNGTSEPAKYRAKTRTGKRGVSPTKSGRYLAFVTLHGANRSLGTFDTADLAQAAHQSANSEILLIGVNEWVRVHDRINSECAKSKRRSKTGLAGVEKIKSTGKFFARITVNKKRIYLGTFDTESEASAAYMNYRLANAKGKTADS